MLDGEHKNNDCLILLEVPFRGLASDLFDVRCDPPIQKTRRLFHERIEGENDPRSNGAALEGSMKEYGLGG
jgi:hypothetical protein